jgi:hypothetical protein
MCCRQAAHACVLCTSSLPLTSTDFTGLQVVSGFDRLLGPECSIERYPDVGLVVISAPDPLHYYSLFSHTVGFDTVLAIYDGNRCAVSLRACQQVQRA